MRKRAGIYGVVVAGIGGALFPVLVFGSAILGDSSNTVELGNHFLGQGFRLTNISNLSVGTSVVNGAINAVGAVNISGDVNIAGNIYASNIGAATTVNASKVSAGVFGSLSTKGNYTFQSALNTNPVLMIDAANERVGVGTATPQDDIHILSSDGGQARFESSASNASVTLKQPTKQYSIVNYNSDNSFSIDDNTLSSQRFVISSAGNVGIGITNPGAKLHVLTSSGNSSIYTEAPAGSYGYVRYKSGTQLWDLAVRDNEYSSAFQFRHNGGAPQMVIQTGGSVGIGTTAPAYKLDVNGTINATQVLVGGVAVATTGTSNTWTTSQTFNSTTVFNNTATFSTISVGTSVVNGAINAVGAVNISGDVNIAGNIYASNIGAATTVNASKVSAGVFGSLSTKGNYTFQASANTNPVLMIDAVNERVGVGIATPNYNLDVNGSLKASGITTSNNLDNIQRSDDAGVISISGGADRNNAHIAIVGKSASSNPGDIQIIYGGNNDPTGRSFEILEKTRL